MGAPFLFVITLMQQFLVSVTLIFSASTHIINFSATSFVLSYPEGFDMPCQKTLQLHQIKFVHFKVY